MSIPKTPEAWYDKITDESILDEDWSQILVGSKQRREMLKEILTTIHEDIKGGDKILRPDPLDIFAFTRYTKLSGVRAGIIGQDPYPNEHAHGVCFSSLESKQPRSLMPIRKALVARGCLSAEEDNSDLRGWAYQGVLLINTSFTTLDGVSKSHSALWSKYFDLILARLVKYFDQRKGLRSMCWLLWGEDAIAKQVVIDAGNVTGKNIVMTWGHPSCAANHNQRDCPENFVNCDHFMKVLKISKAEWGFPLYWDAISRSIECFTDGSAKPNKTCPEAKGGYAVVFTGGPPKGLTIAGSSDNTTMTAGGEHQYTNNIRAEGEALREALRYLVALPSDLWDDVRIVLDCDFYRNLLTIWVPGWLEKRQPFEEKKNADLNSELWKLYSKLLADDKKVVIEHMRSHNKKLASAKKGTRDHHLWYWNNYVDKVSEHAREHLETEPIKSFSFVTDYFGSADDIPT